MKTKLLISAIAIACSLIGFNTSAQESEKKAKIKIVTTENGKVTEIEKEIDLTEDEMVKEILEKNGIFQEINISEPGEDIEVIIRKITSNETLKDLEQEIRIEVENGLKNLDEDIKVMVRHTIEDDEPSAFLGIYGKMTAEREIIEDENGEIITEVFKDNQTDGVEITGVIKGSAAANAGLKEGNIIKKLDGKAVKNFNELVKFIKGKKPGDNISIDYINSGGNENHIEVELGEKKQNRHQHGFSNDYKVFWNEDNENTKPFLGVTLDEEVENGIKIGSALENSTAKELGLKKGDVLKSLNGETLNSFEDLRNILAKMEVGDKVSLNYDRDGKNLDGEANLKSRLETKGMPKAFKIKYNSDDDTNFNYFFSDNNDEEVIVKEIRVNISMLEITKDEAKELKKTTGMDISNNSMNFSEFSIAPNPTQGNLKINFTPENEGKLDLMLIDQTGKQIYVEQFNSEKTNYQKEIDIRQQPKGIYFLIFKQGKESYTKKIIKQ